MNQPAIVNISSASTRLLPEPDGSFGRNRAVEASISHSHLVGQNMAASLTFFG